MSVYEDVGNKNNLNLNIDVAVNYSAIALDFKLFISSYDMCKDLLATEAPFTTRTFTFSNIISKICTCSKFCLVLLETGSLFKINVVEDFEKRELNFLNVVTETPKKSIFVTNRIREVEKVIDVACGENICIAISNFSTVYNIPSKTFQFERHVKIKKLCCGSEHSILLTSCGDIYTWGVGLRGQLGHGQITVEHTPKLVDGLAGIQIIDVSAGGWSSAAVSAFGDLYVWGWNSCGQLGLKVFSPDLLKTNSFDIKRKFQTVYTVPTLVILEDHNQTTDSSYTELSVSKVYCGCKHTIIRTTDNRIFVTGSNAYKQLGLKSDSSTQFHQGRTKRETFIDEFKEIQLNFVSFKIHCSYSCTLIILEDNK